MPAGLMRRVTACPEPVEGYTVVVTPTVILTRLPHRQAPWPRPARMRQGRPAIIGIGDRGVRAAVPWLISMRVSEALRGFRNLAGLITQVRPYSHDGTLAQGLRVSRFCHPSQVPNAQLDTVIM